MVTLFIVALITYGLIYRVIKLHFSKNIILKQNSNPVIRGEIIDRNGYPLALSVPGYSIFADPTIIADKEYVAKLLSRHLDLNYSKCYKLLNKNKRFVWIKRNLKSEQALNIKNLNLKGIYLKKIYKRVNPEGELAAHIIGFVNVDGFGIEGVEYKFDDLLTESNNKFIGYNVQLTIDKTVQYYCYKILKKYAAYIRPKRAIVIVQEVKTGKILAISVYPSFDPENFNEYNINNFTCPTIVDSYEPGSTMKLLSAAYLLEKDINILKKRFYCKGFIKIYDTIVKCTEKHGAVNIDDIVAYSCNAGMMQAFKNVSKSDFYNFLYRFGFGQKTNIEISGESTGILRKPDLWSGVSKYSISIGQEISVTSIQLISAISAIANNGIYNYPHIIECIKDFDGNILKTSYIKSKGQLISKRTSKILLNQMEKVVLYGTGKKAYVEGYRVGGKTGTAQKSKPQGGYIPGLYVVSFIGVAPLPSPDISVLIIFDEPELSGSAGELVAPVFSDLVKRILLIRGFGSKKIILK